MNAEIRSLFAAIHAAAIREADPALRVRESMRRHGDLLTVRGTTGPIPVGTGVWVIAMGKAAIAMCEAATAVLGNAARGGIAAVPAYEAARSIAGIEVHRGGHPLPDASSIAAGRAVEQVARDVPPDGTLLVLLSGGGSSAVEILAPGVSLNELRRVTEGLQRAGAPIHALNTVRRCLSSLKGGGLLSMTRARAVVTLALSDVPGDDPRWIASGPTVPWDPDAAELREAAGALFDTLPPCSRATPPSRAGTVAHHHLCVIGSNADALRGAHDAARARGLDVEIRHGSLRGEASHAGRAIAREILERKRSEAGRCLCLLSGGETTVTVRGDGRGGRNLELALAAAEVLDGTGGAAVFSFATDGHDGATDAAGAMVDGTTARRIRDAGISIAEALRRNDSYRALEAANGLWIPGPAGTNVNDVTVALAL